MDRKSAVSLAESKESTNRMLNTALAKMNRDSAESLSSTQEAFSVMMNDKMDQMHRDAMIILEQIRENTKRVKEILIKNLDKRVHVLEVGGKQMVVNS